MKVSILSYYFVRHLAYNTLISYEAGKLKATLVIR
jgi:hypothetical protein